MTANIGARLRRKPGDAYSIIAPTDGDQWTIELIDDRGDRVPDHSEEGELALEYALVQVSKLRKQLRDRLGRNPRPDESSDR